MDAPQPTRKSGEVATFLEKLYDMLEDPSYDDYISWCKSGETILIKKEDEFSRVVLPKFYKHNNFHSFVRQLNMYSFSKTRHDAHWLEFKQPYFQRGRRDLLPQIKRKGSAGAGGASESKKAAAAFEQVDKYKQEIETLKGELVGVVSRLQNAETNLWVMTERFGALRQENLALWKLFCEAALQDPNNPTLQGIRQAISNQQQATSTGVPPVIPTSNAQVGFPQLPQIMGGMLGEGREMDEHAQYQAQLDQQQSEHAMSMEHHLQPDQHHMDPHQHSYHQAEHPSEQFMSHQHHPDPQGMQYHPHEQHLDVHHHMQLHEDPQAHHFAQQQDHLHHHHGVSQNSEV